MIAVAVMVLRPHEARIQTGLPNPTDRVVSATPPAMEESRKPADAEHSKGSASNEAPAKTAEPVLKAMKKLPALPPASQPAPDIATGSKQEGMGIAGKQDRLDQTQAPGYAKLRGQQQQARSEIQTGTVGGIIGGPRQNQQSRTQANLPVNARAAPSPAAQPYVALAPGVVQPAPPQQQTAERVPTARQQVEVTNQAVAPRTDEKALEDKDSLAAAARIRPMPMGMAKTRPLARKAELKESAWRWAISDTGKVVRSGDAGRTWNNVAVGEGTMFRTLSVNGDDVWAGGARGTLYHSQDAGAHWTRVPVASTGVELTADIVRIEFTDAQHGYLLTDAGERWTTADAGRSWAIGGPR